jgi:hypothetical protein
MKEDKIQNMLQRADNAAMSASAPPGLAAAIRRRARRRHIGRRAAAVAAAACIVCGAALWVASEIVSRHKQASEQRQIAALEAQVKELQARTDAALEYVTQVLREEQRKSRLDQLEAQLAAIGDPIAEIDEQMEETAFIMVYQADKMYNEQNLKGSAIRTYKQVIELFGQTKSAQTAHQRLEQVKSSLLKKGDAI